MKGRAFTHLLISSRRLFCISGVDCITDGNAYRPTCPSFARMTSQRCEAFFQRFPCRTIQFWRDLFYPRSKLGQFFNRKRHSTGMGRADMRLAGVPETSPSHSRVSAIRPIDRCIILCGGFRRRRAYEAGKPGDCVSPRGVRAFELGVDYRPTSPEAHKTRGWRER